MSPGVFTLSYTDMTRQSIIFTVMKKVLHGASLVSPGMTLLGYPPAYISFVGQIARMCIELGLHRRDSFLKVVTTEPERAKVLRLFWSIYVLDRRWSFGTGLPFALQDSDIDPSLPEPVCRQLNNPATYLLICS
jgi:hypothetical protein